jgi:prepilin-type N-terminal cleavage/methylation domain-containing protein
MRFNKGFTLIEILIVLALMVILISIGYATFRNIKNLQVLNSTMSDVVSAVHKAKALSLASLDSSVWGVHFESDKVIIFKSQTYNSQSPDNEVLEIIHPAEISNIGLGGGVDDVYFERITGMPSTTGRIDITVSSLSKSFRIDAFGQISAD